jgi:hypothetical protein
MRKRMSLGLLALLFGSFAWAGRPSAGKERPYLETFAVAPKDLASTGRNTYFILEPGYVLHFEGKEGGKKAELRIAVLDQTRMIAGVETRVVEERETAGGELTEVSRNFYAIAPATGDLYYFGEEVDGYDGGKVVNHEGSWLAGEGENRFGRALPGAPQVGQRYYQEIAPRAAMDRAEIVSLTDTMVTPAGTFKDVLKTMETTPLEPGTREFKHYAAGIGLIKDGALKLTKYGKETPP